MTRGLFALVPVLALGWAPSPAMAEDAANVPSRSAMDAAAQARAQAEVLFQQGSDLLEAGRANEACPRLQAAVDLAGGEALGGKLVLARCFEAVGRIASAWGLYREVATRAANAGQTERAAEADARVSALGPRLHYLELELASDIASESTLSVAIDGRVQPRASLSAKLPIDPGAHAVSVSMKGRSREDVVTIPEGPGATSFSLEAPSEEIASDAAPSGGFWSGARIAGLVIGSVGALGIVGGVSVGAVASSDYDAAFTLGNCAGSPPVCDDASGIEDARTTGDIGTAIFFAGLGVAAVGLVVFIVAPSEEPEGAPTALTIFPGPASLSMQVSF